MALGAHTERQCVSAFGQTNYTIIFEEFNTYMDFYNESISVLPIKNTDKKFQLKLQKRKKVQVKGKSLEPSTFQIVASFTFDNDSLIKGRLTNLLLKINYRHEKYYTSHKLEGNSINLTLIEYNDIDQIPFYLDPSDNFSLKVYCTLEYEDQTLFKSIPISRTQIHARDFQNGIQEQFEEFFEKKVMCDVEILVEDAKFNAHKIVLASQSPVFEAMFMRDMKEKMENTVTITDVDTDIFSAFLKYMYTGKVKMKFEGINDLSILADKYQVVKLIDLCNAYLKNEFENKRDYCFKYAVDKNEYTKFLLDLENYTWKYSSYNNFSYIFFLSNTDVECKLQLKIEDDHRLTITFPNNCKLLLKVFISYMDSCGKKLKTFCSFKGQDETECNFTLKKCFNYLRNGHLRICCEVICPEIKLTELPTENDLKVKNFNKNLQKSIEKFSNEDQFCDLTVYVGEDEIPVHKVILAQRSSVFKSLFLEEGPKKIEDTMTIDDIDSDTAEAFFTFMYTGTIDKDETIIGDLLNLAKTYKVADLEVLCQDYIDKYLDAGVLKSLSSHAITN